MELYVEAVLFCHENGESLNTVWVTYVSGERANRIKAILQS